MEKDWLQRAQDHRRVISEFRSAFAIEEFTACDYSEEGRGRKTKLSVHGSDDEGGVVITLRRDDEEQQLSLSNARKFAIAILLATEGM